MAPGQRGFQGGAGPGELVIPHPRAAVPKVQEGMQHTLPWAMSCSSALWRGRTELLPAAIRVLHPLLQPPGPISAPGGYRSSSGMGPQQLSRGTAFCSLPPHPPPVLGRGGGHEAIRDACRQL